MLVLLSYLDAFVVITSLPPPPFPLFFAFFVSDVSPASFNTMRDLYRSRVPTATVLPLYISERDLDARSMLSMLGVGTGEPPLYSQSTMRFVSFDPIVN